MKPRQSGIPTPGRTSIPTPGRPRSTSTTVALEPLRQDADFASKAFADAIRANDPAQHRASRASDISSTSSLSPLSASHSNGSIYGRPSSVASSSSTRSQPKPPERAKTPTSVRPPSRQSDAFPRSISRTGRAFEVGDNVRIESLGFEGVLRYLGEIDGKPGLWAGVELSGGFSGKGKNNGSVGTKVYFTCPEKCGVFVASTKLSAATVGHGASHRPPSVASSRGGRVTPSISSGRITPSTSYKGRLSQTPSIPNGRITPSGRTTPSMGPETPAARVARLRAIAKSTTTTPSATKTPTLSSKITTGSRAAKYANMTAKELRSSVDSTPSHTPVTPTASKRPSPPSNTSSPSRSTSSPFATPKPRLSGISVGTPKARIPSAVAMPPPPSPSRKSEEGKAPTSEPSTRGKSQTPGRPTSSWGVPSSPRRPSSSASTRSTVSDQVDQLQSRIEALEYENERLRSNVQPTSPDQELVSNFEKLHSEHAMATAEISRLQESLSETKAALTAKDGEIKQAYSDKSSSLQQLEATIRQTQESAEQELRELRVKLEDSEELAKSLKAVISEKDDAEHQSDRLLDAKAAEWTVTEGRLKKLVAESEEEKRDLSRLVDELRQAGQETIALYEERLQASETLRYEFEDRVSELEAKISAKTSTGPPEPSSGSLTSADIENESLQEQVAHLQKKVTTLEDMLEDTRATAEQEEAAIHERMKRVKEREDALKKELSEGKREVERVLKSEARSQAKLAEVEEALRESTLALENAQGEIEGLRGEFDSLSGIMASASTGDASEKSRALETQTSTLIHRLEEKDTQLAQYQQLLNDRTNELDALKKKANRDVPVTNGVQAPLSPSPSKRDQKTRDEVTGLKHIVQELQKEIVAADQQSKMLESDNQLLRTEIDQLRQEVKLLEENLEQSISHEESNVGDTPSDDVESMRRALKAQKNESEHLRKRYTELETKSARTTHDLNKEISELEALVESKIYREDELEQEIERLKEKLSRQKKASKGSTEPMPRERTVSLSSTTSESTEAVCEICERPGHDIFTCDLLKEDAKPSKGSASIDLYCEDCEGHGHTAENCPYSLDVF